MSLFGSIMALGCCDTSIYTSHTSTPHPSQITPLTHITSLTHHTPIYHRSENFRVEKNMCKCFYGSIPSVMRLTDTCAAFLAAPIINVICLLLSVASQLASAPMKRRLSGTNLSSENNLPTFRLNAPVVINIGKLFSELKLVTDNLLFIVHYCTRHSFSRPTVRTDTL